MTIAMRSKNVSNLASTMCAILDEIEVEEVNIKKICSIGMKIDKFMYDLDRQLKKKANDEFYELDFKSADLQAISTACEKHVNKLRSKCTYRSMRKTVNNMMIDEEVGIPAEKYHAWNASTCDLFYAVGVLHRLQCVSSFQAIVLDILEGEEEVNKIENVMLKALKDAVRKDKGTNVW